MTAVSTSDSPRSTWARSAGINREDTLRRAVSRQRGAVCLTAHSLEDSESTQPDQTSVDSDESVRHFAL